MIADFEGILSMPILQELDLSLNKIERIQKAKWPKLKMLNLSNNKVRIIENLENCRALEVLDLSFNEVMKIKHLSAGTNVNF